MNPAIRRLLFLLFFTSGFSSLVYQVVWTRIAFASFGIITPVFSVVLSVFMLGLAVGAWVSGRYVGYWVRRTGWSALLFYACAEVLIGLGAFSVPKLFAIGERLLLTAGETNSFTYLLFSALVLALSILPWCVFMGATFPLMMTYVRECDPKNSESFSFLYLANVLGAMSGTLLTAVVLVELLGFQRTLWVAAAGNFSIAGISGWLARKQHNVADFLSIKEEQPVQPLRKSLSSHSQDRFVLWILFSTGFCAMAMEVVWARAFTPVLSTQVYSFAMVVFAYLGATFVGSFLYRHDLRKNTVRSTAKLISLLTIAAFLPIVANDFRLVHFVQIDSSIKPESVIVVLGSICPLCAILGYLTPRLIDEYGAGHPAGAGKAYAINVLGCILGPLFASYVLLPLNSEQRAIALLGVPFLVFYLLCWRQISRQQRLVSGLPTAALVICSLSFSRDFEGQLARLTNRMEIRRDYAASVISAADDQSTGLFVNGINMTTLTPITKFMVHLPLAFHSRKPESALIICFGMGTSYRSALSWDIKTTAVELVPGVKQAFGFYHADAASALANPKGHIIIDDGRRYLKRTAEKFDVIVIDPPPPIAAAGSSLLYSVEFYELAKQHLKPHGILQAWIPESDIATSQAVVRSLQDSFPYVRCFASIEKAGAHLLASEEPIEPLNAKELAARMPTRAKDDLLEWSRSFDLVKYLEQVLSQENDIGTVRSLDPGIRITDDRPYNEYFLLRWWKIIPETDWKPSLRAAKGPAYAETSGNGGLTADLHRE